MKIRHVVFSHYENLRWYFIDTLTKEYYFISLNIKDIKYLLYGVNILLPPLTKNHIKWN